MSDDEVEPGSLASYEAIFRASKAMGSVSKQDMSKAEDEMLKFWNKGKASKSSKSTKEPKKKFKEKPSSSSKRESCLDLSFDTEQLLKEAADLVDDDTKILLREAAECCSNDSKTYTSKTTDSSSGSSFKKRERPRAKNSKGSKSKKLSRPVDEITISDNEESDVIVASRNDKRKPKNRKKKVVTVTALSDNESELEELSLGQMLLFQAELENKRYPIQMYELQCVRELRCIVAEKTKIVGEQLLMFLGDYIQLNENEMTLRETGIQNLCTIDVYIINRTEKELYESGSSSVLRFKIQTSDRRGRQDSYVYVSKTGKMETAVLQYSKIMGVNPLKVKLNFDGDNIDLNATPEACELEGDECLDLHITE